VVRETVLALERTRLFEEAAVCVCAAARLAAAITTITKEKFFTRFSISGGDKNCLIFLLIFVDTPANEKNRKG
jgi:hypothetical protein